MKADFGEGKTHYARWIQIGPTEGFNDGVWDNRTLCGRSVKDRSGWYRNLDSRINCRITCKTCLKMMSYFKSNGETNEFRIS